MLIGRGMGEGVALDILLGQGCTGAQHDERDRLLAFDVVINRDQADCSMAGWASSIFSTSPG